MKVKINLTISRGGRDRPVVLRSAARVDSSIDCVIFDNKKAWGAHMSRSIQWPFVAFSQLISIEAVCCCLQTGRTAAASISLSELGNEITISQTAPDKRGGQAYKMVYQVRMPMEVYWKFKTDFDFDFLGAALWADYPWGGGIKDFLTYTARWEQDTVLRLMDRYSGKNVN